MSLPNFKICPYLSCLQNRRRKKLMRQTLGKRPSGGSGAKSTLLALENNHHQQNHSPSPPSSRKGSREQPLQACLSHGLSHGMSHHHNLRVQLPPSLPYKDIPESPVWTWTRPVDRSTNYLRYREGSKMNPSKLFIYWIRPWRCRQGRVNCVTPSY